MVTPVCFEQAAGACADARRLLKEADSSTSITMHHLHMHNISLACRKTLVHRCAQKPSTNTNAGGIVVSIIIGLMQQPQGTALDKKS